MQYDDLKYWQCAESRPDAAAFGLDRCFSKSGFYCGQKGNLLCVLEVTAVQSGEPVEIPARLADDNRVFSLMARKMGAFIAGKE